MKTLKQQIINLSNEELTAITQNDKAILIKNDEEILVAPKQEQFVFYYDKEQKIKDIAELKKYLENNFDDLITKYYQQNSLSLKYFNAEVFRIAGDVGFKNLIKTPNKPNKFVLAAGSGKLECPDESDYRFKYGLHFELEQDISDDIMQNHFNNWVNSNNAYQDYISIYFCTFL